MCILYLSLYPSGLLLFLLTQGLSNLRLFDNVYIFTAIEMNENEAYSGVSLSDHTTRHLQENDSRVLMNRNECYATTQDVLTTANVSYGRVPRRSGVHTDAQVYATIT